MTERGRERPELRRALTPVARGGLTDRVIDQLRHRIADGTWPLHHRLPVEAALANDLGVGRSTIREAVRVLVHAGLLEVRQGNGTFVRSRREIDAALQRRVADADVLEAFEVRRMIEIEIARLAAHRRSDADARRLRELANRSPSGVDAAVHELLLDVAGNPLLADLYRGLTAQSALPTTFDEADLFTRAELDDLVDAVERGDPDAAADAAARAMDNALRVLKVLLQVVVIDR